MATEQQTKDNTPIRMCACGHGIGKHSNPKPKSCGWGASFSNSWGSSYYVTMSCSCDAYIETPVMMGVAERWDDDH